MEIESGTLKLTLDRSVDALALLLENKRTGNRIAPTRFEIRVFYSREIKGFLGTKKILSNQFSVNEAEVQITADGLEAELTRDGIDWKIRTVFCAEAVYGAIRMRHEISCSAPDVIVDKIRLAEFGIDETRFLWSAPVSKERSNIPAYILSLGQPAYIEDVFVGGEFPTADTKIRSGIFFSDYHLKRSFADLAPEGVYTTAEVVFGGGSGADFNRMRASFFEYIGTIARPARFRIQFNSWYDNMLDITSEKIKKSFTDITDGFRKAGLRPLDCYVVDDGWTDYKKVAFWDFDKESFPEEFYRESALTAQFGSTFGVWFGPRGGYTYETPRYAARLKKIGYHVNPKSHDICTADPRYIADLCAKMADFCKKYNVTYFKIDGFACAPCPKADHGHPVGKGDGIDFYTFLWEHWLKGFETIRAACPDVFLNVTSYSHCSPWFLRWADAVWLNNAADMYYEGRGSNLDQCLNYRDGRYRDYYEERRLQFPAAYIYNHEPCYAERNYNPPLPARSHKTVVYTTEEFEKYLYMCMMRGTGFVELYLSPSMMDDAKYAVATKVLQWAEANFSVLKNSQFFGGKPSDGCVYGYYAGDGKRAIMAVRNSSDRRLRYDHDNQARSFSAAPYAIREIYPQQTTPETVEQGKYAIELAPYEMKIFELDLGKRID